MHFVMSTKIPLVLAMTLLLSQPEFRYDNRNSFTTFFCSSGVSRGSTPLTGVQPGYVVLHPGRNHRALNQVSLIHSQVGGLHHGEPSMLIRIVAHQAGIA